MAAAAIIAMRNAKKKRDEHFDNMTDEEMAELDAKRRREEEEANKPKYNKASGVGCPRGYHYHNFYL